MRHWCWALSARPTSRNERVLPNIMSATARMNTRCRPAACAARIWARAAR